MDEFETATVEASEAPAPEPIEENPPIARDSTAEGTAPKKSANRSPRDILEDAYDKAGVDDDPSEALKEQKANDKPKPKAKAEPKEADKTPDKTEEPSLVERDENGRFAAKNATSQVDKEADSQPDNEAAESEQLAPDEDVGEAPKRFSEAGKKAWAQAPKEVRDEITRAVTEMEGGIEKYRALASEIEGIVDPQHMEVIHQSGQRGGDVINKALQWEAALGNDFIGGMDLVAKYFGHSLHDVASEIIGQAPNVDLTRVEQRSAQLERELTDTKNKLAQYERYVRDEQTSRAQAEIDAFFAANPGALALQNKMSDMMRKEMAETLPEAYRVASLLYGEPDATQPQAPPPASEAAPEPPQRDYAAQTRKASKSVSGAPGAGSNPSTQRPPPNPREAAVRGLDKLGITF